MKLLNKQDKSQVVLQSGTIILALKRLIDPL